MVMGRGEGLVGDGFVDMCILYSDMKFERRFFLFDVIVFFDNEQFLSLRVNGLIMVVLKEISIEVFMKSSFEE